MFKHRFKSVKIEESIKQTKPFTNIYEKMAVNIMFTNNWVNTHLKKFFGNYELTTKQYNILRILKGAGKPVTTAFIRERLLDRMSDVSRIVDRMNDKGLVAKSTCSSDKRLVDVALTTHSQELLKEINNNMVALYKNYQGLSEKEALQLNELLDKLRTK